MFLTKARIYLMKYAIILLTYATFGTILASFKYTRGNNKGEYAPEK